MQSKYLCIIYNILYLYKAVVKCFYFIIYIIFLFNIKFPLNNVFFVHFF